jgi:hypothetical protein
MTTDTCDSCGMPMPTAEDHALADPALPHCRYCSAPDGSLKSYDEVLGSLIVFLQRTQGLEMDAARGVATSMLSTRPAWRERQ